MNYQAYFTNANQLGVTFEDAYSMLSTFLNVMSTLEHECLMQECEQYKWNLEVITDDEEPPHVVLKDHDGQIRIDTFAVDNEEILYSGNIAECEGYVESL